MNTAESKTGEQRIVRDGDGQVEHNDNQEPLLSEIFPTEADYRDWSGEVDEELLKKDGSSGCAAGGRELTPPTENAAGLDRPADSGSPEASNGIFHFHQFVNLKIERPGAIIDGLVYERQTVLLIGRFGVGKTMFGTQMSIHLAIGREFLGLKIPRPRRTMYLDFENDLGDMKDRVSKQRSSLAPSEQESALLDSNWVYVDGGDDKSPLHRIKLDSVQGVPDPLLDVLKKKTPEVLIIDNLGLVATNGDLTKPEEAARFFANLAYIRSKIESLRNGVIIVFHHLTKPSEESNDISLLTSPYEYLSRARGSGRVLDYAKNRLALAEETVGLKKCHVVNGINRSGAVSPLILQFNSETLSFERHPDTKIRFDAVFSKRSKGLEIYRLLPEKFTFNEAAELRDSNGKKVNRGTLSETLKPAVANDFIRHSPSDGVYTKVFDPQTD